MSSWEPSVPELWMSRAALCEAAEDGDADKVTRMLSGTDPKGAAMRLPHGDLVPSFEDTFYEPEHIGFVEGFARRGLRECTATCAERGHAAALRALLDWQPAPDWSFSQQPLTRGELLLEIFHDRFRDAPYMMKKKGHMSGFNDTKYDDEPEASALMLASKNGHTAVVEMLLETYGADIDFTTHDGETATSLALKGGPLCKSVLRVLQSTQRERRIAARSAVPDE